eukprot:29333-Pelagococcus_subviridis.AAC.5
MSRRALNETTPNGGFNSATTQKYIASRQYHPPQNAAPRSINAEDFREYDPRDGKVYAWQFRDTSSNVVIGSPLKYQDGKMPVWPSWGVCKTPAIVAADGEKNATEAAASGGGEEKEKEEKKGDDDGETLELPAPAAETEAAATRPNDEGVKNVLVERGACRVKKCTRPCPFDGYKANEIARGRGRGGSRKKKNHPTPCAPSSSAAFAERKNSAPSRRSDFVRRRRRVHHWHDWIRTRIVSRCSAVQCGTHARSKSRGSSSFSAPARSAMDAASFFSPPLAATWYFSSVARCASRMLNNVVKQSDHSGEAS